MRWVDRDIPRMSLVLLRVTTLELLYFRNMVVRLCGVATACWESFRYFSQYIFARLISFIHRRQKKVEKGLICDAYF